MTHAEKIQIIQVNVSFKKYFMISNLTTGFMFSEFNTTGRAVLSNINPLRKQGKNAAGVSVLFAKRVYVIQYSPIWNVNF